MIERRRRPRPRRARSLDRGARGRPLPRRRFPNKPGIRSRLAPHIGDRQPIRRRLDNTRNVNRRSGEISHDIPQDKPPRVNASITTVYVGDLNDTVTKSQLDREFSKFGQLKDVWISKNPIGYAFVYFYSRDEAQKAIDSLNEHHSHRLGCKIRVEFSNRRRRAVTPGGVKKKRKRKNNRLMNGEGNDAKEDINARTGSKDGSPSKATDRAAIKNGGQSSRRIASSVRAAVAAPRNTAARAKAARVLKNAKSRAVARAKLRSGVAPIRRRAPSPRRVVVRRRSPPLRPGRRASPPNRRRVLFNQANRKRPLTAPVRRRTLPQRPSPPPVHRSFSPPHSSRFESYMRERDHRLRDVELPPFREREPPGRYGDGQFNGLSWDRARGHPPPLSSISQYRDRSPLRHRYPFGWHYHPCYCLWSLTGTSLK